MRGVAEIARQAVSTANRMQRELAQPRNSAIKLGVAIRPIDMQYQLVSFWLSNLDSNQSMHFTCIAFNHQKTPGNFDCAGTHGEVSAKNPTWAVRQIGICTETFSFRDAAQKFGLTAAPVWQNRPDFHRIVRAVQHIAPAAHQDRRPRRRNEDDDPRALAHVVPRPGNPAFRPPAHPAPGHLKHGP